MTATPKEIPMFDAAIFRRAIVESFRKLSPRTQVRNPVMFTVFVGGIVTLILWVHALGGEGEAPAGFILAVSIWLWFAEILANFAEAVAEGRGKAQADALRQSRTETIAKLLVEERRNSAYEH